MSKLMHLTSPWDNGKPLEGMLTSPINGLPLLDMPRFALKREIRFQWEPVTKDAEYRYTISLIADGGVSQLLQKDTRSTSATIELPPSKPNQLYRFNIFAKENGQTVGTLFVHDAGAQAWDLSFRVGPRSVALKALVGGMVLLVIGFAAFTISGRRAAYGVIGALSLGLLGYLVNDGRSQRRISAGVAPSIAQQTRAGSDRPGVDRALIEEFTREVPLPAWWNQVEPALPIHTFSTASASTFAPIAQLATRRRI